MSLRSVCVCWMRDVVDTERARAGDEAERWIDTREEDDSQERPFPGLSEQAYVSSPFPLIV